MTIGNIGRSRAPNPASGKGSSEQGPEQPQSALPPQESPELAPEPAPDSAAKLVILDAATDRATPDDVHVLDVYLPTYFGPSRRQLTRVPSGGSQDVSSVVGAFKAVEWSAAHAAWIIDMNALENKAIERAVVTEEEPPPAGRGVREGDHGLA